MNQDELSQGSCRGPNHPKYLNLTYYEILQFPHSHFTFLLRGVIKNVRIWLQCDSRSRLIFLNSSSPKCHKNQNPTRNWAHKRRALFTTDGIQGGRCENCVRNVDPSVRNYCLWESLLSDNFTFRFTVWSLVGYSDRRFSLFSHFFWINVCRDRTSNVQRLLPSPIIIHYHPLPSESWNILRKQRVVLNTCFTS
jgi:hypothetical protein